MNSRARGLPASLMAGLALDVPLPALLAAGNGHPRPHVDPHDRTGRIGSIRYLEAADPHSWIVRAPSRTDCQRPAGGLRHQCRGRGDE